LGLMIVVSVVVISSCALSVSKLAFDHMVRSHRRQRRNDR
jgi:hypothetical protein